MWNHEEPSDKGNGQIHPKMTLFHGFGVFMECLSNMGQSIKDLFGTYWKGSQRDLFLTPIRINTLLKKDGNSSKRTYFHGFWHAFDCFWHVLRWKVYYMTVVDEKGPISTYILKRAQRTSYWHLSGLINCWKREEKDL